MPAIEATITSQGQVTIPVEVRRHLGLAPRDKVTFRVEADGVRLLPAHYTLESACGAVPALPGVSADFDREIEEAMEDEADRIVGRTKP